jgi:Ca2+-transporting ATPase
LPRPDHRTLFGIVLGVVREPMFALLLGAGAIYLALGSLAEALVLITFASVSVAIAVMQESRSERVLEALRDLTSPRALVIRDGERKRIPGREVVRGDVIVLAEGDRVPADARLVSSHDLQVDESLLSGESIPVRKRVASAATPAMPPGGDDLPFVFSGTMAVRGRGLGEVMATGSRSEIGKIGLALGSIESEPTRLARQTRRLVRVVAIAGIAVSAVVVLLYGVLRGAWLEGLLGGIALSMSMLPEEFPLVLTVFMVMGAWRISRARVLTRRAATIETLGAATVLCTDKTGTLTQNRMSIVELRVAGEIFRIEEMSDRPMPELHRTMVRHGILASAVDPFDPMEKAFHELGRAAALAAGRQRDERPIREYGLRPDLLAVSQVWAGGDDDGHIVAAKGAPEAIATLCRFTGEQSAALRQEADAMAQQGMRVLAVATASFRGATLPAHPRAFEFRLLGLVGLADPLRPGVPEAVRECRSAGIRVVMITGDYPATARAIAMQAGLDSGAMIEGGELDRMSDADLAARVGATTIFARITPAQKLRIVTTLKANGHVVAMTGDGVNDAPSLKAAHIGVAMGGRGTDVAREAASIVLLDDDFGSIVRTIRLGRRIYDNLRKAMGYILAVHVPVGGLALLPLLFGLPLLLGPVHIAFLEMVIDPVCSIVFEAEREEDDVMRRKPRDPQSSLFSGGLVVWSLLQGGIAFLGVGVVFWAALARGMPEDEIRALTFLSLVLTNIGLILANRSFSASLVTAFTRPNRALWWIVGTAVALLIAAVTWPPAERLFRFGPLHADDLLVTLAAGIAVLVAVEWLKPIWRRRLLS